MNVGSHGSQDGQHPFRFDPIRTGNFHDDPHHNKPLGSHDPGESSSSTGGYAASAFRDPLAGSHLSGLHDPLMHSWEAAGRGSMDASTSGGVDGGSKHNLVSSPEDTPKRSKPKSSKTSSGTPRDSGNANDPNKPEGQRRAAQACLRCRKQKLRCTGGWPCKRCEKAKHECDFGKSGPNQYILLQQQQQMQSSQRSGLGHRDSASEATARLEQLESSVANLLAGLAGGNGHGASGGGGGYPNGEIMHTFDPPNRSSFSSSDHPHRLLPPPSAWAPPIPPPTHIGRPDVPRFPDLHSSSDDTPHVRFNTSPTVNLINPPLTSPSNYTSSGISPGSAIMKDGEKREKRLGKGEKAEERLAAAEGQGPFDAPFKALVYHVSRLSCPCV